MPHYENCKQCNSVISCSCQYQQASDGTQCCDNCIDAYEIAITIVDSMSPEPPVVEESPEDSKEEE
jgi:hypothetical protein